MPDVGSTWKLVVVCRKCGHEAASTVLGLPDHDNWSFSVDSDCPLCAAFSRPTLRQRLHIYREVRRMRRELR